MQLPDSALGPLVLAADELMSRPDWAALAAALNTLNPPGYNDQAEAATDTARAVMAAEAHALGGTGVIPTPHTAVPDWIRLDLLTTWTAWAADRATTCTHAPRIDSPQPVLAAAWKPGLIACGSCTHLLKLRHGSAADRTCDGCGKVTAGPRQGDGIHPSRAQLGPLIYMFGACRDCLPDYRAHPEATA